MDSSLIQRAIQAYGRARLIVDPVRIRLWEDKGLTTLQFRLMHRLLSDRASVGCLARELNTTPASVTGLTDRLVARGFVEREHDREDHRVVRLSLTPAGRQALEDLESTAIGYVTRVFERMDERLIQGLIESLEAFCEAAKPLAAAEAAAQRHE